MYQDKNGWTPVSEGLPDDGQEVFCWYESEIGDSWCYTRYLEDGFDSISNVTHWRPIFKLPVRKGRAKPCLH